MPAPQLCTGQEGAVFMVRSVSAEEGSLRGPAVWRPGSLCLDAAGTLPGYEPHQLHRERGAMVHNRLRLCADYGR